MYGPGIAPPPPRPAHRGVAIGLRVLFTVLPVLSLGLLAWVSTLRLALVRKGQRDWVMTAVPAGLAVIGMVLIETAKPNQTGKSGLGGVLLLVCMFGTAAYFLVMDIRRQGAPLPVRPAPAGYPTPNPYTGGPVISQGPARPRQPPYGYGHPLPGTPTTPPPTPPPVAAPAPRIHQVRAELDELSDYLRKEEGR
jgi:hypothetical protein